MIFCLEVDDVVDVRRRRALCLLRVTQACARGANGFALLRQAISIQRTRAELFPKQRRAFLRLPKPIVERSERLSQNRLR